jgi:threonine dehydrogenase-like Zn-dependent dehydrogenase
MLINRADQAYGHVIMTHEFPMSEVARALDASADKQCGKILVRPQR